MFNGLIQKRIAARTVPGLMAVLIATQMAFGTIAHADPLPSSYSELNDYVIPGPNQGEAATCVFMAATAAMEVLYSRYLGIKNPLPFGPTDLSERYLISEAESPVRSKTWFEDIFLKFDSGTAVLERDMPFSFYDEQGNQDYSVWSAPENFATAPRVQIPKVDTVLLFEVADKYARGVLDPSHVQQVKEALIQYKSPILAIGNDEEFWHATVILGYDDQATDGKCYELAASVCAGKPGAFYVRDSFGEGVEKRSYEWFIRRGNAAAVAKLADTKGK